MRACPALVISQLQRSRTFSGAERSRRRLSKQRRNQGFNGAAPFQARKAGLHKTRTGKDPVASTEPHLFRRGKESPAAKLKMLRVPLQRSRTLSGAESGVCQHGGLHRVDSLQRSRTFSGAERRRGPQGARVAVVRFNGAAPFQARKGGAIGLATGTGVPASTEPHLFRRGKLNDGFLATAYLPGFNGAAPFQARKERKERPRPPAFLQASTEPHLFRRGKSPCVSDSAAGSKEEVCERVGIIY